MKHSIPKIEAKSAGLLPQRIATKTTTSKKANPIVVALTAPRKGSNSAVNTAIPSAARK